ncbi:hypothetical protein ACFRH4_24355 [Streptomyces mirabilis]|uniref:hypothetical protein n=1 Tax=Streptomyces mirabilis TaxID=68239 RepID=UPI0036B0F950
MRRQEQLEILEVQRLGQVRQAGQGVAEDPPTDPVLAARVPVGVDGEHPLLPLVGQYGPQHHRGRGAADPVLDTHERDPQGLRQGGADGAHPLLVVVRNSPQYVTSGAR